MPKGGAFPEFVDIAVRYEKRNEAMTRIGLAVPMPYGIAN
jgi:hypothetical protein